MSRSPVNDFGIVDHDGDLFEFHYGKGPDAVCAMESVLQTEKGPMRRAIAEIPAALWRRIGKRAVRELLMGLGNGERDRRVPGLKIGTNRLSPMVGRELAVLLWALMEKGAEEKIEAILSGWRELAREERWWLFMKASTPGQRTGVGWRRALYHAFSEPHDTRAMPVETGVKKKSEDRRTGEGEADIEKREQIEIFMKNSAHRRIRPETDQPGGAVAEADTKDNNDKTPSGDDGPKQMGLF